MKKFLVLFLVLVNFAVNAQQSSKNSFGLTAGAGNATVLRASLEGGPSLDLESSFEFGANYYRTLGERLKFETGLFYHYNRLIQKQEPNPGIPQVTTHYDVQLLYAPAFIRYNLTNVLFINGGGIVDLDLSNIMSLNESRALDNQSGLGAGIGIGGELAVLNKFYIQINPYLNLHAALMVKPENIPGRILNTGIKLGIRTK